MAVAHLGLDWTVVRPCVRSQCHNVFYKLRVTPYRPKVIPSILLTLSNCVLCCGPLMGEISDSSQMLSLEPGF